MSETWEGADGTRYALVQYKPSMSPHLVITRPGDAPRGRCATDEELALASALADARAENARLREAIGRAAGICEDAAAMRCDCNGYYTCGTCPERISTRADDAADVLRAALAPKESPDA